MLYPIWFDDNYRTELDAEIIDKFPLCVATEETECNELLEEYLNNIIPVNDKILLKYSVCVMPTPREEMLCTLEDDLLGEIWKDMPNYEGLYMVSNKRRIKSYKVSNYGTIIKTIGEYNKVSLCKNGISAQVNADKIARLVFDNVAKFTDIKDTDKINAEIEENIARTGKVSPIDIFNYKSLNSLPGEEWKPVVDMEDTYAISNLGRVKRIRSHYANYESKDKWFSEKVMALRFDKDMYVICYMNYHGKSIYGKVHQLVLKAFAPKTDEDIRLGRNMVDHINNCRFDNNVRNLRWATALENAKNRISSKGKQNG